MNDKVKVSKYGGIPVEKTETVKPKPVSKFGGIPVEQSGLTAAMESAAVIGSSMVAQPLSGLAGMAGAILPGPENQGSEWVDNTQEFLTLKPRGEKTQEYLGNLAESDAIQGIGKGMVAAETFMGEGGEAVGNLVNAPGVGYAMGTAFPTLILERLGFKGVEKSRGTRNLKGIPDDVIDGLSAQGIDIDDLSTQGIDKIMQGLEAKAGDEIARLKAFEQEGIPTSQSRISQEHGDFLSERRIKRADTPEGKALRIRQGEEAAGFQDAVIRYREAFGISESAGDSVKGALQARISGLKSDVQDAYAALDLATDGSGFPLIGNKVLEVFDDPKIQAFSGRLSSSDRAKLNDILIEYGLDTDSARATDWINGRKGQSGAVPVKTEITPLNLNNFEEMRQAISNLSGYDQSPELRGIASQLKKGIDNELLQFDELNASAKGSEAIAAAKRARQVYAELKGTESTKTLVGRLAGSKKGAPDEQIILSSQINKKLLSDGPDGAPENIDKLFAVLDKSPNGKNAIANIQAATAGRLLEKGVSKQIGEGGGNLWNAQGFISEFDRLEKAGKLESIFKNNPDGLEGLRRIRELSLKTKEPAQVAKASGTADDIANMLGGNPVMSRMMGLLGFTMGDAGGLTVEAARAAGKAKVGRKAKRDAKKALEPQSNDYKRMLQGRRMYSALYGMLLPLSAQEAKEAAEK